jgi:1-acyl-sn-glycerol-3-phosphate acyltransferase
VFTYPIRIFIRFSEISINEVEKRNYKLIHGLCKRVLKIIGEKIIVRGMENLEPPVPTVYICNHKSNLDIFILLALIDEPFVFIGKKEIEKFPIVNTWFKSIGCIILDREDIRESLKAIMAGIEKLKEGRSIAIFPEGSRGKDDELKDLKRGSFKLATKTNVPITPIALQYTHFLPEEKKYIRPSTVFVNIGRRINMNELGIKDTTTLSLYTKNYLKELLAQIS